jgi:hypothetical protein
MYGVPSITGRRPSLDLIVKTRRDDVADELHVLSASEADATDPRSRLRAANEWLAALDRRYHFVALEPLEVVPAIYMPSRRRTHALGLGITVDWDAGHLQVAGTQRETPATWMLPDHPTTCELHTPQLETVHGDLQRSVVVLVIGYASTDPDRCVRPPLQVHVVAW